MLERDHKRSPASVLMGNGDHVLKHNIIYTVYLKFNAVLLHRDDSGGKKGPWEYSSNHNVLTHNRVCTVNPKLPPVIEAPHG